MQNQGENKMGVMPVGRLILNMSLPMILSMLVQAMYNIVDSVYVSRVSEAALTAVSLCFPAQNLMNGLATGTAVGVNALLSRALGAGDRERASKVAENGVFLALVGYAVFLAFGLFGSRIYMATQTGKAEIVQMGVDYLTIVCCCSFGMFGQVMFERLMQSTGRTVYTMFTQGLGAAINIVLDPVFIFTLGMGVKGAAVATVVGQIIAFIVAVVLNERRNPDVSLKLREFRPDGGLIGRIYAIGIPSAIMIGIGSVMTFLMNIILINYTTGREIAATVFGVYFKLSSFAFMPVFGLNNGVIPIIAYNYGAKNRRRMTQAIKVTGCYAMGFMLLGMALFLAVPDALLGLFDASETMLAIGAPALRIISVTFPVAAVCIVISGAFQGLGYGVYSMITSLARQLIVLVPSAYILARIGLQTGNDNLVWLSYPIAEVASAAVTALLFVRLYRKVIRHVPEGAAH